MVADNKEKAEQEQVEDKAPAIQETAEFKEALRKATSKYQTDASQARKALKDNQQAFSKLEEQVTSLQNEVELAKIAGDDDEEKEKGKRLIQARQELARDRKKLADERQEVQGFQRNLAMQSLTIEYGIPVEELEKYETATEMEIAALKWERGQRDKKGKGEKPAKKEEEEGESGRFEAGEAKRGGVKMPDPVADPKAWDAYEKTVLENVRRARDGR